MTENITARIEQLRAERKAEAARLRAQGLSLRTIAERLGVSAPQVLDYLRQLAADDPDDDGGDKGEGFDSAAFLEQVPRG